MRTKVPATAIVGLAASVLAIILWAAEQLTDSFIFEMLTMQVKVVVIAMPLFFLSDLSGFLNRRPRVALGLGGLLIAATLGAMLAYLPWRSVFAGHFNNDTYRWYYEGMPVPASVSGFGDWQKGWSHGLPQMIEAGIVLVYYTVLIAGCTLFRLGRFGGAAVGLCGYGLLVVLPTATDLIRWEYDIFLRGIALDSISLDLTPLLFWYAKDFSIFLYAFMLIFFAVSAAFIYRMAHPRPGIPVCTRIPPLVERS
jgi:hypothetical protein